MRKLATNIDRLSVENIIIKCHQGYPDGATLKKRLMQKEISF